ncbi:hypothetical protein AZO1586I_701 [Bathymodiolus thermophilus thioautotrophic gill symbiont]|uniref:Uncharacterized protein n=2 Tax=sulfur-oxidizing symbionts TaxID=32036 RepID=A0ACA8ZMT0_9GAMM|nr:hypothetical protein AZO1586R_133 [Bathymodiolus azoricus thioautotrophic gill symbiont]CAB5500766.1 hypothetical protein AZO1586I_701 [Bathymodiolus thermophilus thioautotrophic gill symbiont]CAC9488596.1 hypothetical protein [uncultured Gammaproteobacteria bacterium]CAC9504984.1 hypothetical protein [uncultured Gammaproteobacteria bacterium]CAC9511238.1 hypothetical protein [uncultured Gammaproteobacteria bacterium]
MGFIFSSHLRAQSLSTLDMRGMGSVLKLKLANILYPL